jgi:glucosamine--fructose-6-phosphate aminotransferase (isomerizing)
MWGIANQGAARILSFLPAWNQQKEIEIGGLTKIVTGGRMLSYDLERAVRGEVSGTRVSITGVRVEGGRTDMNELHRSHLYREIHEQPEVLARLVGEDAAANALAAEIHRRAIDHVVIAARGTSDNAARYAQYLLGAANGLSVGLATPSLFTIYRQPPRFANALVLGISQSGRSPDIVAVLAEAQQQGALTAAISNTPSSDLVRTAEFFLDLCAGEERSVAATKTYTAELAAIALLSVCLDANEGRRQMLERAPDWVAQALEVEEHVAQVAERYRYMQSCVVIGRGYNYATAFELALKLKELTYTVVEPYSSADFLHGPLAMVAPGFPVIIIAPSGLMLGEMETFLHTLKEREAEAVVVSDAASVLALARVALRLPSGVPEWLSPLVSIVPGQLLAMYLAHARDYDVDHPRALHKVTETR